MCKKPHLKLSKALDLSGVRTCLWDYSVFTTIGIACALALFKSALVLPSGYGAEEFLYFTDDSAIKATIEAWRARTAFALAYFSVDLALFIPAYAILSFYLINWLEGISTPNEGAPFLAKIAHRLVLLIVPIDIVETAIGLYRMKETAFAVLATAACLGFLGFTFFRVAPPSRRPGRGVLFTAVVAILFLALFPSFFFGLCGNTPSILAFGCSSHEAKLVVEKAIVVTYSLSLAAWLYALGVHLAQEKYKRRIMRVAISNIVVRSRYVVALLIVAVVLLLGMDQCQDALIGILADLDNKPWFNSIGSALVSVIAVLTFSYSCWLWSRVSARQYHPLADVDISNCDSAVETFAKYWARALGLIPWLAFSALCGKVIQHLVSAGATNIATFLFWIAVVSLGLGLVFLVSRDHLGRIDTGESYFNDKSTQGAVLHDEAWLGRRYKLFGIKTLIYLPIVALFGTVLCRIPVSLHIEFPPLVFPSLLFSFSAVLGFFGWIAFAITRTGVPWGALLLVLVAVLNLYGWNDNHIVWTSAQHQLPPTLGTMYVFSLGLAMILGLSAWSVVGRGWSLHCVAPLTAVALVLCLLAAGRMLSSSSVKREVQSIYLDGIPLNVALRDWIIGLHKRYEHRGEAASSCPHVPVYFVAAEGGGLRAGYWTALALQKLEEQSHSGELPTFLERTFALSTVSGSSLGAATLVACHRRLRNHNEDKPSINDCIDSLGKADLISSNIGAWFFEDIVAKVVPTSWCNTPACGFMSRGIWFERTLQDAIPELRNGMRVSRDHDIHNGKAHLPYLLLNSTWVETGERAIASELDIHGNYSKDFPAARDTLAVMYDDLTLGTAAHNSARFPFVNAIGLVKAVRTSRDDEYYIRAKDGHVADGGYFDNGASQTTIDLFRGFREVLTSDSYWPKHQRDIRAWAKAALQPRVIYLHNGTPAVCDLPETERQPTASDIGRNCRPNLNVAYSPECQLAGGRLKLYADVLGVPVTAANTIASHRFLADTLLITEIRSLQTDLDGLSACRPFESVIRLNQTSFGLPDLALYPLGWYLSKFAQDGMKRQAADIPNIEQFSSTESSECRFTR